MPLPERMRRVAEELATAPPQLRVELLAEYAERATGAPRQVADPAAWRERVTECRTPLWVATHVAEDGGVEVWFEATPEAATALGFAGALRAGVSGATIEEVLAIPEDVHRTMGLAEVVSPLRQHGMEAVMVRIKRQLAARQVPSA